MPKYRKVRQRLHDSPMFTDGNQFLNRALLFQKDLRANSFPNATTLATAAECSKNTAQRTIDRLRQEYGFPIEFNRQKRGYFLTNHHFQMPLLIPSRQTLEALLLMRELCQLVDAAEIRNGIDRLWQCYTAAQPSFALELEKVVHHFSAGSTAIGWLGDNGVFEFLDAASSKRRVRLVYKSPWRHKEARTYTGTIREVRYSDGSIYLSLLEEGGRNLLLNLSSVRSIELLPAEAPVASIDARDASPNGFGIWRGGAITTVEIRILPPAAEYYALQRWHEAQEDRWEEANLVRTLPATISPEIVRRILSLGPFVADIAPKELKDMVLAHVEQMQRQLTDHPVPHPRHG